MTGVLNKTRMNVLIHNNIMVILYTSDVPKQSLKNERWKVKVQKMRNFSGRGNGTPLLCTNK